MLGIPKTGLKRMIYLMARLITAIAVEAAGQKIEQTLRDIFKEVTNKEPGGHILTGSIYIEGAEPGDALEVRIVSIKLAIPYKRSGPGWGG